MWRADGTKPTTNVPFVPQETFAGLAAAGGRAHLVSVVSNEEAAGTAQRLEPADQTGRVRVRTWDPTDGLLPTAVSSIVGTTPRYQFPSVDVAARTGLLALAWEDAATRSIMTASSVDGGLTFGAASVVPESLGADALQLAVAPSFAGATTDPVVRWDWSVPERYKPDTNGELVPWQTPVPAEPQLTVTIDGSASTASSEIVAYQWTIDGVVQPQTTCLIDKRLTANTDHKVRLQVTDADGRIDFDQRTIRPRDLLVVSIGDSIASGEGNPTVPASYTVFGNPDDPTDLQLEPEQWVDQACHRSAAAGPAQAARRLERLDRKSSITFVHLACSGASVISGDVAEPDLKPWETGGVLDPYQGIEPIDPATSEATARPSQLDQLQTLLGGSQRPVDAMFVSIGANDVRFSDVVRECIKSRVSDPLPCNESGTGARLDQRLGDLPRRYEMLADALGAQHPELAADPSRVFITEYFDPTTDSYGLANLRCIANAEDVAEIADYVATITGIALDLGLRFPLLSALSEAADIVSRVFEGGLVTDAESRWANTEVVGKLNGAVRAGATANGWTYVGGIAARFRGHGYCANDDDRWVVTIGDSISEQFDANGPVHPNEEGHLVFANGLARAAARIVLPDPADPAEPGQASVARGELGEAALAFTVRYEGGINYLGRPQSLVVANLRDHGAALEATDVRVIDRLVGAPAETVSTWYQGQAVAVSARASVATWLETYTANLPGGTGYDSLAGQAFMGAPDVAVDKVSIVQAPDDADRLVAGKATVVRTRLFARLAAPTAVSVRVVVNGSDGVVHDQTTIEQLRPGINDVILPSGSVLLPEAGDQWRAQVLVTDPGDTAPDEGAESNDVGESIGMGVESTTPMTVLFAPAAGSGATCADAVRVATKSVPYARAALPLPEQGLRASYGGIDPSVIGAPFACPIVAADDQTLDGVTQMLHLNDRIARLAGVDAIVGIVPEGWLQDADPAADPWGMALIPSSGPPNRGAVLETGVFDNVLTHELTHLHGIDHTELASTEGVWVARRQARSGPDYMFRPAQETRWAHPDTFDRVLEARRGLASPVPDGSGVGIRISGTVAADGIGAPRVTLDRWVSTPEPDPAATSTQLVARQLDADGGFIIGDPIVLSEVDADYPTDGPDVTGGYYSFAHAVTLHSDTSLVEIVLDGEVIATRDVTPSAPTVEVTSPAAGAALAPGGRLDVEWTATDVDVGDVLTHSVLISTDGGANWQPLAVDLADPTFSTTIPNTLTGTDVRVRVVSSDGVRSGVGESGSFSIVVQQRGPERVAYTRYLNGGCFPYDCTRGVWSMNPDGTDVREIAAWVEPNSVARTDQFVPSQPDWSPDGRRIAFESEAYYANPPLPVGQTRTIRYDVFVADADGTDRTRITQPRYDPSVAPTEGSLLQYFCPDWSPDGTRLAAVGYAAGFDNKPWIVSMAADGSDFKFHGRIGSFSGLHVDPPCPRWSPDGRLIAAAVEYSGRPATQSCPSATVLGGKPTASSSTPTSSSASTRRRPRPPRGAWRSLPSGRT